MKTFYTLFLAFLLSLPGISQSFREQFTEANLLTEDGYYGIAIPIWQELLKERNNANINYKLGSSYLNLGIDRDRALPYLLAAAKNINKTYDPFSSDFRSAPTETYYYLAQAYHIAGDIDSSEYFSKNSWTTQVKSNTYDPKLKKD